MKRTRNIFIPDQISRKRLAEKLCLEFDENMQDWEYEVSNPCKLDEFINEYDKKETTQNEKEILMEIILDSLNDLIIENKERFLINYSEKIKERLERNSDLHIRTLNYWTENKFEISNWLKYGK